MAPSPALPGRGASPGTLPPCCPGPAGRTIRPGEALAVDLPYHDIDAAQDDDGVRHRGAHRQVTQRRQVDVRRRADVEAVGRRAPGAHDVETPLTPRRPAG